MHLKRFADITLCFKAPDMYNYIIPRSNGTVIVGTTTEPHNW